jgi:hypothetical protein
MTHHAVDSRAAVDEFLDTGPIAYYRAFAAVAGGVTAGVFLSQLYYWHDRGSDPDGWIYKIQAEWEAETGLTRREQETARRKLRERGIVEEKLAGLPAQLHYRLDVERLTELLAERSGEAVAPPARERAVERKAPDRAAPSTPRRTGNGRQQSSDPAAARAAVGPESARQGEPGRPHKLAQNGPSRSARDARQAGRKPPDQPARNRRTGSSRFAHHAETTRDDGRDCEAENEAAAASPMTTTCSIHGETMLVRRKDGDAWYSHRLPNGTWCRGAPGDQPGEQKPDAQSLAWRRRYAAQFGVEVVARDAERGPP